MMSSQHIFVVTETLHRFTIAHAIRVGSPDDRESVTSWASNYGLAAT